MRRELDEKLCKLGPTLFADRFAPMTTTAMCWGFECGDGWYDLLEEAITKLEPLVAAAKKKDPEGWDFGYYRASQVKEKYGTLRFYMSGETKKMSTIIRKAERRSSKTCEACGKAGKLRGDGWYVVRCDACNEESPGC